MSEVLLILNHNFVALPNAEAIIIGKKNEINAKLPNCHIDQFLLSNIALDKVELIPNHYDSIYYLDSENFNPTIPNHPSIKQSLKLSSTIPILKKTSTLKNSKLRKFKRLPKAETSTTSSSASTSSSSPSPSIPELIKSPTPDETEKKLKYFSDSSDEDDELIDERELIETSLNTSSIICLREPNTPGVKRRKACKDCTCGLAEKEAFGFEEGDESTKEAEPVKPKVQFSAKELTEIDFTIEGKTGGCGSCSLGDAFRCSGCPFLGLPAFKPGQAITLDGIDDDL